MKIGIIGSGPADLKHVIEAAIRAGAQIEFISEGEREDVPYEAPKPMKRGAEIPVATANPEPPVSEMKITRGESMSHEFVAKLLSPAIGRAIREQIPYSGKMDLSKYSDEEILVALLGMGKVLESEGAVRLVNKAEEIGKLIAVDFYVELDRCYGGFEGGFEVGSFPELADAMFELFLEYKKDNAKIEFDFELAD